MARRVFFSFHYQKDIFRVSQVRNSGMTKGGYQQSGFIDHAEWEQLERQGEAAIKRWINSQLDGATVTVVLIGSETANRPWVNYEIKRSHELGLGLLGIHIHQLKCPRYGTSWLRGENPFSKVVVEDHWLVPRTLADTVRIYDWVDHDGYNNMGRWIEEAAQRAGRGVRV
ncbi:MAG: TIR domain-containing protein [Flavobacteriales bacterium]|nr:MAG: TIR domain-containing protein [Flavobacteriales bacterium]